MSFIIENIDVLKPAPELIKFLDKNLLHRVNEEVFKWEYRYMPDKIYFNVAKTEGQIISSQSMLPIELDIDGKIVLTAKSENSVLANDYKERGGIIFNKIYKQAIEETKHKGISIFWGYTDSVRLWNKIFGFEVKEIMADNIITLKPLSFKQYIKRYSSFYKAVLKYSLDVINSFALHIKLRLKLKDNGHYKVETDVTCFDALPGLTAETKSKWDTRISLHLSKNYINWRVLTNPALQYKYYFFYKAEKLAGYYLYSINKGNEANLADVFFTSIADLDAMLVHFINDANKKGCTSAEYFHNSTNKLCMQISSRLNAMFGGKVVPNKFMPFVMRNDSGVQLPPIENWMMNALWTEGFKK